MGKPPSPPSDNPFLPRNLELQSLDGETDLESLPEVDAAAAEEDANQIDELPLEEEPAPQGTDVDWGDHDLGAAPTSSSTTSRAAAPTSAAPDAGLFGGAQLANLDGSSDDDPAAPSSGPDPFGPPLDLTSPVAAAPVASSNAAAAPLSLGAASPDSPAAAKSTRDAFAPPSYEDVPIRLDMTLGQMVEEKKPQPNDDKVDDIELAAPDPTAFIPIPGRFMEGRLRQQAALHVLIGVVLSLGIGYLVARPVQRRSEMRIEYLHQQAAREMQRGHEEATAEANRLENQAENESKKAFVLVGVLWLGIGGGLFALYWRFT